VQRIKFQKKNNSIMLTVEWFRFCVYISRQADIGSGNIDLRKPFQMFHFSEMTTHLSPTLKAETEKHSTSPEIQSSYIVLLANADSVISNKNTAENSYCNLWIPWLTQIAPGTQLTLMQFLSSEHLTTLSELPHPSVGQVSVFFFLADREIQTAILQMLNTHNQKTVGKGVPSTKPIIDYLSVQLGR